MVNLPVITRAALRSRNSVWITVDTCAGEKNRPLSYSSALSIANFRERKPRCKKSI